MSQPTQGRAEFATVITGDNTAAGASYAALGSPLSISPNALVITSTYDKSVWVSTDGTNNMLLISAGMLSVNLGANKQGTATFALPSGTQFYLKQGPDGAPTTGDIAISSLYGV